MDENTKAMVERVAEQAAEQAVQKVLTSLGVDHVNPLETQRDMAALREWRSIIADDEFRKDLMHLRKWRQAMDGIQNKGMLTVVGVVFSGLCAALWVGLREFLGR